MYKLVCSSSILLCCYSAAELHRAFKAPYYFRSIPAARTYDSIETGTTLKIWQRSGGVTDSSFAIAANNGLEMKLVARQGSNMQSCPSYCGYPPG